VAKKTIEFLSDIISNFKIDSPEENRILRESFIEFTMGTLKRGIDKLLELKQETPQNHLMIEEVNK